MPRRNNRERYVPLDLTMPPRQIEKSSPVNRANRVDHVRQRALHQMACRAEQGIDWNICLMPGCGRDSILKPTWFRADCVPLDERDPKLYVPLCFEHGLLAFDAMSRFSKDPGVIEALATLHEIKGQREKAKKDAAKVAHLASTDGHIYFVQVGDLIKVGWTRILGVRLKQYGASAVLLAHYPARRDAEKYLHRNLKPALARGREWYHNEPIVQRYIAEVLAEHGPPTVFQGLWTEPKQKSS